MFMEKGPKWPDLTKRLPSLYSVITFTGKLFQCEHNENATKSNWKIRIAIALDSITYLPRATYSSSPKNIAAPSTTQTNTDTVALTKHAAKYEYKGANCQDPVGP
jgi:hypothetical protein